MRKFDVNLIIAIALIAAAYGLIRSCDYKHAPVVIRSVTADSIQRVISEKVIHKYDSMVRDASIKDSLHAVTINSLQYRYNKLKSSLGAVRKLPVDSAGQTTGNVSAQRYNDLIDESELCDSLVTELQSDLVVKDSIISYRTDQYQAAEEVNKTSAGAIQDLQTALEGEQAKSKRTRKLVQKIPVIMAAEFAVTWILISLAMN